MVLIQACMWPSHRHLLLPACKYAASCYNSDRFECVYNMWYLKTIDVNAGWVGSDACVVYRIA